MTFPHTYKPKPVSPDQAFFMVWAEASGKIVMRHPTYEGARIEAERLAIKHPGNRFFLMVALANVEAVEQPRPAAVLRWNNLSKPRQPHIGRC